MSAPFSYQSGGAQAGGIEPVLCLRWLNFLLTADEVLADPATGVREWHEIAPASVRSPYGVCRQLTASADLTGLDAGGPSEKIWVPVIMQIMVLDRVMPNYARIEPLAARIYTLLQRAQGEGEAGIIYGAHRTLVRVTTQPVGDAVERLIEQQFTMEALSA